MLTVVLKPWAELTAADLESGGLVTVRADATVLDAARRLYQAGVTGAPVVDDAGKLVGVFSRSDVARYLSRQPCPSTGQIRTCMYQDTLRVRDGREVFLCTLAAGRCQFQREGGPVAGRPVTVCAAPHELAADWQVVDVNELPADDVRHHMTADPVVVGRSTPAPDLARRMGEANVHRVIVVDDENRPTGVVSSMDIVRAVAFAPPASPVDRLVDGP